jgi:hypothetical protein
VFPVGVRLSIIIIDCKRNYRTFEYGKGLFNRVKLLTGFKYLSMLNASGACFAAFLHAYHLMSNESMEIVIYCKIFILSIKSHANAELIHVYKVSDQRV